MEVTTIQSWGEFDSLARDLDGWAFRGQRDADWSLLSSLSRHLKNLYPTKPAGESANRVQYESSGGRHTTTSLIFASWMTTSDASR